jgi:hypothetical protein
VIHFTLLPREERRHAPAPAELTAPVTPAAYLALRRRAARLSARQVAERLPTDNAGSALALELVRVLETPGNRARRRETIEAIAAVIPLDVDVYFQLADEPAERHPTVCRGCGCSAHDVCHGPTGACSLDRHAFCSRCDEQGAPSSEVR